MKRTTSFNLLIVLVLVLVFGNVNPAWVQEKKPEAGQAVVGTKFTYQGRLTKNGVPVNGVNCLFTFNLYAASSGGSNLGSSSPTAPLNDGYFAVALDYGAGAFTGDARWLEVSVQCPGDGSPVPLSDKRIELTPAPYAHSLRPGAVIQNESGIGLHGQGTTSGLKGETSSIGAQGVYGLNSNYSSGYGVYGQGFRGVQGYTASSSGAGGFFMNMDTTASGTSVGIFAGSYYGDIIQGHELDAFGNSIDRRFRVNYQGQVYADGNFNSGGADLAEMLPAAEDLEPGDVLTIGSDGSLVRNQAEYASTVAGVYSTRPGFIGGSSDDLDRKGKIPLAIAGIVPVKASAVNGTIRPGDLLVASSNPGHAMKGGANPPIGTVIGKALSPLSSGTGVIKMLVTLQ
jgi:hypothetical protein